LRAHFADGHGGREGRRDYNGDEVQGLLGDVAGPHPPRRLGHGRVHEAGQRDQRQQADELERVPLELEVGGRRVQNRAHQAALRGHVARPQHHGENLQQCSTIKLPNQRASS